MIVPDLVKAVKAGQMKAGVIREKFEAVTLPAFGIQDGSPVNENGEYKAPIEDHWNTFQEGWEEAVKECLRFFNEDYTRNFDVLWREDLTKSIKNYFDL